MNSPDKKALGRPSHSKADFPHLVLMAENWRAGTAGRSARKLSLVAVGLDSLTDFEASIGKMPLVDQKSNTVVGR